MDGWIFFWKLTLILASVLFFPLALGLKFPASLERLLARRLEIRHLLRPVGHLTSALRETLRYLLGPLLFFLADLVYPYPIPYPRKPQHHDSDYHTFRIHSTFP